MQLGKIGITALITLLTAGTTGFIPNCSASFCVPPALAQTLANRKAQADRLVEQGNRQFNTSQYQGALQSWQQSLTIYREIGDRQGEAYALKSLGYAYINLGEYRQAIEFYQQHLALVREIGNRGGEADSLYGLGWAYNFQGQYKQAIEFFQQTLAIARETHNRPGEADSLHALGWAYDDLGQRHQAIELYQQALTIAQEINDRRREANILNGLGWVYNSLGQYQRAIDFFEQQLIVAKETDDLRQQANALNGHGWSYKALGQYQRAIEFSRAALAIQREIADRREEAYSLGDLGVAYSAIKQYPQAILFLHQALAIQQQIGNRWGEGITLSHIGEVLAKQKQPELAIVFYKQSVNVREAIRRDIQGLPQEQQQSFTETVADTYRTLADLLLKKDRVLEAQRVLDLLKVQELEDYLRNVRGNEQTDQGIPNSPQEQQIQEGYEAILDKAIQLGEELNHLEAIPLSQRTSIQKQRIVELRKIEQEIAQEFQDFLSSSEVKALVTQMRQTTGGEGFDLEKYATSLQDNLKRLQQDAVILYPFILDDRLELVLVTPYAPPIRRTVPVQREELNRAIAEFRSALGKPNTDAKTPARKLYDWLIKPIENDLAQAKTKTIIYTPDGQLRYIPLAALYDGN